MCVYVYQRECRVYVGGGVEMGVKVRGQCHMSSSYLVRFIF